MSVVGALARFSRRGAASRTGERCELCAAPAAEGHRHVLDLERRAICCACETCARLFVEPGAGARFRTIPDRVLADPEGGPTAAEWATLGIPVRVAFLFRGARDGRWSAAFPGPAGTTIAELADGARTAIAARLPLADGVEPDVEALLFHGAPGAPRVECLLVPIDECYALSGRLRRAWRGFDGGDGARAELEAALAALRVRARPRRGAPEGER